MSFILWLHLERDEDSCSLCDSAARLSARCISDGSHAQGVSCSSNQACSTNCPFRIHSLAFSLGRSRTDTLTWGNIRTACVWYGIIRIHTNNQMNVAFHLWTLSKVICQTWYSYYSYTLIVCLVKLYVHSRSTILVLGLMRQFEINPYELNDAQSILFLSNSLNSRLTRCQIIR